MSDGSAVRDTSAWHIVRQLIDHTWGGQDLEDAEFVSVCTSFRARGGLWESLMGGDMDSIKALETSLDELMRDRSPRQASRLSFVALHLIR